MVLLRAEDVYKSYPLDSGRLYILKGVNLEVERARVHITMPKDSLYLEARQPAKASRQVMLIGITFM